MKPRVLCLMQLPPPIHGATVINDSIVHSARLGARFELDVLPLRFAESLDEIRRISPRKLVRSVETMLRLGRSLAKHRPDAVYFTLTPTGIAFYRDCLFVAVLKAFDVPRIYHLHGKGISEQLGSRWRRALYRWVFRDAHVIQLSDTLMTELEDLVTTDRVETVPNGVADVAGTVRRNHTGPPRVLYLSNMIESKGPLVLLDALGELSARGHDFIATYAGAQYDEACPREFHARVRRFGLTDRVRYIGPVYGEAKDELLREHDVLAFPSHNDTFPLVVLEAMRAGLPVVSTFEGCIPEMVENGRTGRLVPPRDSRALADVLAELLADPRTRSQMGERGRARYLEHFTLDRFESNLGDALARFLAT